MKRGEVFLPLFESFYPLETLSYRMRNSAGSPTRDSHLISVPVTLADRGRDVRELSVIPFFVSLPFLYPISIQFSLLPFPILLNEHLLKDLLLECHRRLNLRIVFFFC